MEGLSILYSSYIVGLIVLVFFSKYLTFLAVFPYSPGLREELLTLLLTAKSLLCFSLRWFNISSANFSSVKLVY